MRKDRPTKLGYTHLDKVFWPKEKYTKGDVIDYYARMAPVIFPYLKDRPCSLNRHPNGIAGIHFYEKNIAREHAPSFVRTIKKRTESGKVVQYPVCDNIETLLYFANLGCIEMNPWASRTRSLEKPDLFIADLDPEGAQFEDVVKVALELHKVLDELGLPNFCKTSGKRGLHIYVPLNGKNSYEESREFGKLLGEVLHRRLPKITSLEAHPSKRKGKVRLDYLRNGFGQTAVAPYSLRPAPGATVSTPLEWKEVKKGLDPKKFTIKTIWKRLDKKGDLWKGTLRKGVDLKKATAALEKLVA